MGISLNRDEGADYINANNICGAAFGVSQDFICGQAPLHGTMGICLSSIPLWFPPIQHSGRYLQCVTTVRSLLRPIASPTSLASPFTASQGHWWHMIWQAEVSMVVMVAKLVENGTVKALCYWPEEMGMCSLSCIGCRVSGLKMHTDRSSQIHG